MTEAILNGCIVVCAVSASAILASLALVICTKILKAFLE